MARLNPDNLRRAQDLIRLYPRARSALIPILHVAQEQDGWLTPDAIGHVAELLDLAPAEVYGTASFYDMFFTHPVGRHLVSVCTNLACLLNGADELLEHAEERLGIAAGGTTPDGEFTLEEVECIALCGAPPCLAVNWRFFGNIGPAEFDRLMDDLSRGRCADQVPPHGTLCRVRRKVGLVASGPGTGRRVAPPEEADSRPPHEESPSLADAGAQGEVEPAGKEDTEKAAGHARSIRVAGGGTQDNTRRRGGGGSG